MAALHAFHEVMDLRDVMQVLQRNGHQRRTFCQRLDPMTYYSDVEFLARFRLSKESFDTLLTEIRHLLPSSWDRRAQGLKERELTPLTPPCDLITREEFSIQRLGVDLGSTQLGSWDYWG
ncbi:hypothetical protein GWK47_045932 [Chionoecetes opilio]|uniref:Uncharacterized protein n=1 Tax=Chionoecetes opilio TaxID=41210 RepID=A0A8J4YEC7_CHIOP|nr:hypothetical protein GWK47_045932 [Chionoecetes opilio]